MPYFTTAELRALPDITDDEERFPDERLEAAHDWIVSIIERECETSFVHKERTERLSGHGGEALFLSEPYVSEVTAVSVDGVALESPVVAGLYLDSGVLYQPLGGYWSRTSRGNVTVTYVGGWSETPPADLKEAALRAARNWLLTNDAWSGVDTRATAITNELGNINLAVASADERPTGLPDVDATIVSWARRVRVPKVS